MTYNILLLNMRMNAFLYLFVNLRSFMDIGHSFTRNVRIYGLIKLNLMLELSDYSRIKWGFSRMVRYKKKLQENCSKL